MLVVSFYGLNSIEPEHPGPVPANSLVFAEHLPGEPLRGDWKIEFSPQFDVVCVGLLLSQPRCCPFHHSVHHWLNQPPSPPLQIAMF